MENDKDLYEVLASFKGAIQMIEQRLDQMEQDNKATTDQLRSVESILFDDIINPAKQAMDNADREERFGGFSERNAEKLGAYNDTLKSIEGDDDFDLTRTAFDNYENFEGTKPDEDVYVDMLIEKVEEQLGTLKDALGLPEDAEVTAEMGEDGDVEIIADGEVVAEGDGEATEEEAPAEAEDDMEIVDDMPEEGPTPEEEEDLEKSAAAALSKAGKLPGRN